MRYLGIDAVALYWLVQSGELPIYRSHANRWCYKRDEVVALAEKATRDGRALSMCRIAEESGANISTVNRLANNTIKRIPVDELTLLCRYLDCNVGDLIRMEEVAT
jgi:putative transcriptional regulator